MDLAETIARFAIHQHQEDPNKFDFDSFIIKEIYYRNYPDEEREFKKQQARKRKAKGLKSIAEEKNGK